MGDSGDPFAFLTLFYFLGAGFTIYSLAKGWRAFWSRDLSAQSYQMAAGAAFFLLVPLGVLLHEVGHMVAAWSVGARVLQLGYFGYFGFVEYIPLDDNPLSEWYVALTGNAVSFLLGVLCLVLGVALKRARPIVRVLLLQLGLLEVAQTLIFYPLIDLDPGFQGDWEAIYSFRAPVASGITAAVHLVSLVALVLFLRYNEVAKRLLPGPPRRRTRVEPPAETPMAN